MTAARRSAGSCVNASVEHLLEFAAQCAFLGPGSGRGWQLGDRVHVVGRLLARWTTGAAQVAAGPR